MKRHEATGFTLLEMLTVVVIVAILAAVAYPGYQDHVRKSKRAEGKAALLRAAQVLERQYSNSGTYLTAATIDLAPLFGLGAGATVYSSEDPSNPNAKGLSGQGNAGYTIAAANPTAECPAAACFLLIATPTTRYDDPQCGVLTITSTGVRCWSTTDPKIAMTCTPAPANAGPCRW